MTINKQNNRHTISPQTHIVFIMPCPKGIGSCQKLEQVKIRVGNKWLLVITGDLFATTVTQRATSFHYRWYLFLLHLIIQSSINISCPWVVNSHSAFYITILMINRALIAMKETKRAMRCNHQWYLCLLYWMIK